MSNKVYKIIIVLGIIMFISIIGMLFKAMYDDLMYKKEPRLKVYVIC